MNFYQKLLERTDEQVLYLTPEWCDDDIVDFKISFSTSNFNQMLGVEYRELKDCLLGLIFPEYLENGILEILMASYKKKGLKINFERYITKSSKWFAFKTESFDEGVCLTCRDITSLKEIQNSLKETNEQLAIQNQALNEAEKLGKSANFRWSINNDLWEYSVNFFELLPPASFENASSSFFDLLSEADNKRIKDNIESTGYYSDLEKQFFSIQSDKFTKHFSLTGHFVPTAEGQLMVGVIKDITEEIEKELDLKAKNEALEYSNHELDSFNHIASHDLQEPLRKVQMFISRLSSTDKKNLSERGSNYIDKISEATHRMQNLIQHLLTYSRIGKQNATIEALDLTTIVNTILEDIKEAKGDIFKVRLEALPYIEGIAFLIEQLFVNIISNAVKYKHQDRALELHITGEIISEDVFGTKNKLSETKKVAVIKISDNGIGFDNEFAAKIFEPFQRLHQKNEYHGTGIGLAICKKIIQAHKGEISAFGIPDKGSTITLKIPIVFENDA